MSLASKSIRFLFLPSGFLKMSGIIEGAKVKRGVKMALSIGSLVSGIYSVGNRTNIPDLGRTSR